MTTTLQLINQVRRRANLEQSEHITDSDTFISNDEILDYLNEAGAELHETLVATNEDYFTMPTSFSLSSSNIYSLPTNFYKFKHLEKYNNDGYLPVYDFTFKEYSDYSHPYSRITTSDIFAVRYLIVSNQLHINPPTLANGNYRLWYIPGYTNLTEDTDEVSFPTNHQDYMVMYATLQCRIKENTGSTEALQQQVQQMMERIIKAVSRRGQPRRMTVIRSKRYGY